MKKKTLNFTIKDPLANTGEFTKVLTASQWRTVQKVVGNTTGESIYWYVESWDGVKRYARSEVMSFILQD
jgi:hypothetical protein